MRRIFEEYGMVILAAFVVCTLFGLAFAITKPVSTASNEGLNQLQDTTVNIEVINRSASLETLEEYTLQGLHGQTIEITPHQLNGYTQPTQQTITFDKDLNQVVEFIYTPQMYSITYELNGGQMSSASISSFTVEDETYYLPVPIKEGYRFIGWSGVYTDGLEMDCKVEKGSYGNRKYIANWEMQN